MPRTAAPPSPTGNSPTPSPTSSSPRKPLKRSSSASSKPPSAAAAAAKKRARLSVGADETTQVTCLDPAYRLPLADGDCFYVPDLVDPITAQAWHDELLQLSEWYRPTLKVYGRDVVQSRKIAAFATDPALEIKYSGHPVQMSFHYPPLLRQIQDLVEARTGCTYNHCMLNLYENGSVYIGKHRDNRENRVIASLSLGAPRTFILSHVKPPARSGRAPPKSKSKRKPASSSDHDDDDDKDDNENEPKTDVLYSHRSTLASGSLLVMQGTMQQYWKHEIPREAKTVEKSRISLTFRQLVF